MARSILIVDDDPDISHILITVLTEEGFQVRCALDGRAALDEIDRAPPDLVLVDVVLPHVDGIRLTRQLQTRRRSIPVILMSAVYSYVDLPGRQFIPKPFDLDVLLQAIAHALPDQIEA
jgi:two-component system sensor histidine kinase/response regulator